MSPQSQRRAATGGSRRERAADRILEVLRATGPDAYNADPDRLGTWHARCVVCGAGRTLTVTERGREADIVCARGCPTAEILTTLKVAVDRYPSRSPAHPGTIRRTRGSTGSTAFTP
jgi:hypothetical protein